jgi:hypothetical protein
MMRPRHAFRPAPTEGLEARAVPAHIGPFRATQIDAFPDKEKFLGDAIVIGSNDRRHSHILAFGDALSAQRYHQMHPHNTRVLTADQVNNKGLGGLEGYPIVSFPRVQGGRLMSLWGTESGGNGAGGGTGSTPSGSGGTGGGA